MARYEWRLLFATLLPAALGVVHTVAAQAGGSTPTALTGDVRVMTVDFRDERGDVEVYLHSAAPAQPAPGAPGRSIPRTTHVYKLEGPLARQLRTGQRVSIVGSRSLKKGGSGSGGSAGPESVQVASIKALAEPPYMAEQQQQLVITPPMAQPASRGAHAPGRRRHRRLAWGQEGEDDEVLDLRAEGGLPTVKLSLRSASISILLIPLSFEGCTNAMDTRFRKPWWTQKDLEAAMFEDVRTNASAWNTVAGRFRSCSHGQVSLTRANSAVAPVVRIPCTGTTFTGAPFNTRECSNNDYTGFREAALEQLKAQGFDYSQYRHHLVVLPLDNSCPWVGMADLGCGTTCAAWVQGDTLMGFKRGDKRATHPVMHEIGHNLYLQHATTSTLTGAMISEYGDTSCPMGKCCSNRCYNAPHAWQLGWLEPQLLDSSNLRPGQSRTVTFYAHSRSMHSGGLQINATWAPSSAPLYISYRVKEGGDKAIETQYGNRVLVHSFPGRSSYDSAFTRQLGVLRMGDSLTHDATSVTIKVVGTNPRAGTATVSVTRGRVRAASRRMLAAGQQQGQQQVQAGCSSPLGR